MIEANKVAGPRAAMRSIPWTVVTCVVFCALAILAFALVLPAGVGQAAGPVPAGRDLGLSKEAQPARLLSAESITSTLFLPLIAEAPASLLIDDFESGIGLWTPFLNYWRLEPGQWYWGPSDGVGGSGAATHDCCIGDKEAADALLMHLGDGAEGWTDYRVEAKMLLRGGVDKEHNWSYIDGDPIGLWVRGQYEYVEGVTIRAQWVTGYYVVIAGKPDRDNLVVRLTQIQTLDDCMDDACDNPQNLYTFNNIYPLAETPLYKPYLRDVWYKLTVEVRGPRITVWLDDQQVIDYVDTKVPFLTGTVGFKTHETWTASFDDLVVTPLQ